MSFSPDYRHMADVMANRRPQRLPLYEHIICPEIMETISGSPFAALYHGNEADLAEYFRHYCGFFRDMSYDVVSFEVCITEILPEGGALSGGKPGPIQTRADYEAYPWDTLPALFWQHAGPKLDALVAALPAGMKAIGGIGNGVFEISEDLVGLEYLPFIQVDDPQLYADLFCRIGDTMCRIWGTFLERYSHAFVACRFGDDLGFKSSLLTNPSTLREQIFPQYQRLIDLIHGADQPFLFHCCGCIFDVMDEILALGIDAKHSNEDTIAPFDRWITDYGRHIGLLGGFDMDFLCTKNETEVYTAVLAQGSQFRLSASGYALGSGNSIPDYVPPENYLAMVHAAQAIRTKESPQGGA
jgi:uroporphyrinogen decarboxylase